MKSEFKNGELFEIMTATIHGALKDRSDVTVRQNVKIKDCDGQDSQVDVCIDSVHNGYPAVTIIECKDYKRPIGVGQMRDFISKAQSLGAQQKVFVAKNGFQKGAKIKAEKAGVILSTLHECNDAQIRNWMNGVPQIVYTNQHKHLYDIQLCIDDPRLNATSVTKAVYIINGAIMEQKGFSGVLVESLSDDIFNGMGHGDRKEIDVLFNVKPNEITAKIHGMYFEVKKIAVKLILTVEVKNRVLDSWSYSGENVPMVSAAAAELQFNDHSAFISVATKGGDENSFSRFRRNIAKNPELGTIVSKRDCIRSPVLHHNCNYPYHYARTNHHRTAPPDQ